MKPAIRPNLVVLGFAVLAVPMQSRVDAQASPADPSQAEVPLPAAAGWQARLVYDAGVGVWTVACAQVQPWFGCPEILAMDDRGRCTVLRSYSGKWTPQPTIEDGAWLAPVACGDLDPGRAGSEVYTGGKGGRLWQLVPRRSAHFDSRIVAEWPGEEIHTLVLLEHATPRPALLVFLWSGRVHLVDAGADGLQVRELPALPGRVRQAVPLPGGADPWIAAVGRTGRLQLLRLRGAELQRVVVAEEPMGLGRVAVAPGEGDPVLYVTRDDGVVLRFTGRPEAGFHREVVMVGAQGPRGIVAGRFHADPKRECLAVFGYSRKVVLLSRAPESAWESEVIYTDTDKGHWLARGEVDGRNGTDELIGSGYSGRVFLLSRPPGYGLPGVAVSAAVAADPVAADPVAADPIAGDRDRPIRVGFRARSGGAGRLTPLLYTGGFEPKSMLYETLVRRDGEGRIVPGLASRFEYEDGGRLVRLELREGARFHDGTAVTAAAVREHFRRWIGFPEHDWLPANRRILDVTVAAPRQVLIHLDRPWAVLPDLCAINPCAVQGPGSRDREGVFERPIGTGPFRLVSSTAEGARWLVERCGAEAGPRLQICTFPRHGGDPIAALLRGDLDVFVGGWDEDLPAERLRDLERDPGVCVVEAPGSSVVSLRFRLDAGPTAAREVRRAIAGAISRSELIRRVEGGRADPCTAWAAPAVAWWPRGSGPSTAAEVPPAVIRIGRGRDDRSARVAGVVAAQLQAAGFAVELVEALVEAGATGAAAGTLADVTVRASHGVPYDPHTTLVRLFGSAGRLEGVPPQLRALVDEAAATPGEERRIPIYARIQALLDSEVLVVPLYVPRRLALHRAGVTAPVLDLDGYRVELRTLRRR